MPLQPLAPVSYEAVKPVKILSSQGVTPTSQRQLEAATQTFNYGVPLMLNASQYIVEFSSAAANLVYGVAQEPAHNLVTPGVAQDLNQKSPPNQPGAITTPIGAWPVDGRMGLYEANGQTVFSIALKLGQVFTQSMIGGTFGLTKDATSGFWFLDNTVTTGNSAVAICLENDSSAPNSATYGARVFFTFAQAKRVFQ